MNEALLRRAHAAVQREDWVESWLLNNAVLNEEPHRPEALYLMGATMRSMGNLGMALMCLTKALAYEQKHPNLWMAYAATLHDLNRWEDAIEAFGMAHKLMPQDPMPIANISASLVQQGNFHESLNKANEALALDPTNYIAKIAKALASLSLGRWRDGWECSEYLYGYHMATRTYDGSKLWDGTKGQCVVVQCDQGLGDQILFASCLGELINDSSQVIVDCSPRMVSIFERNFPRAKVYGTLKQTENVEWPKHHKIDAHIHISFLGKFYRPTDESFPRKPYLHSHPDAKAKWEKWLSQFPKPWYGIAWKGGIQATSKHLRSVGLNELAPVLSKPGTFIDLSYQDTAAEVSNWNLENVVQIVKPPIHLDNYDDTVALVDALDQVVCVTTTLMHVRGSLGKSCHVLVPSIPQWREAYRLPDDSMIWYPANSVRLHRQAPGEKDFEFAIKRLSCAL